jgi:nucleoid DNA-binding protein
LKELSKKAARQAETDTIVDVLSRTDWNRKKAAALLKTSYRTLLSKIKEYEIEQQGASIKDAITRSSQPVGDSYLGYFERAQKGAKTGLNPQTNYA